MASLNKVQIIGNLGADPELRHTGSGVAVANISVATAEKWKDKQTGDLQERTEWHRVVFFDRKAEVIAEYMRKGRMIYVEGRIETEKYTDKQGVERYATKIIGIDFQMLGGGEGERQQAGGGQRQAPAAAAPAGNPGFEDDEIPF